MAKSIFCTMIFVLMFATSETALATNYNVSGKVASITTFSTANGWNDVIHLEGVTSAGPCATDGNGLVKIRFDKNTDGNHEAEDRMYALALTAYTLGVPLRVRITDDVLLNGHCTAIYFKLDT